MTLKKVDLIHYVNGERRVIGEAYVDIDGGSIDVTANITDPKYVPELTTLDPKHLSIGFTADSGIVKPTEAAYIPALKFAGKPPKEKGKKGRRGL